MFLSTLRSLWRRSVVLVEVAYEDSPYRAEMWSGAADVWIEDSSPAGLLLSVSPELLAVGESASITIVPETPKAVLSV